MYNLGVAVLGNVSIDDRSGGSFRITLSNSSVTMAQLNPMILVDMCIVFWFTLVQSFTSSSVVIVVERGTRISIACVNSASLFACLQSASFSLTFIADGGIFSISTTAVGYTSAITSILTGSAIFSVVSSVVANSAFSIAGCTIVCGLVCQVAGAASMGGEFYVNAIRMFVGIAPMIIYPALTNSTIVALNCNFNLLPVSQISS